MGSLNKTMMTLILFTLATVYISVLNGQEFFSQPCPKVLPMSTFNISRYTGLWYEVEKFGFIPEILGSCVRVEYKDLGNNEFGVNIIQNLPGGFKQMRNPGRTLYRSKNGSADFNLYLKVTQSLIPFTVRYPYMIVDTDYSNYTIKWSCTPFGFGSFQSHFEGLWILTRTPRLSREIQEKVHNKLRSVGIDPSRLQLSDTSTCNAQNDLY